MKKYLSLLFVTGFAFAGSQVSTTGNGYLLRMKFKPGAVYKYAIGISYHINKTNQSNSQSTTMKVLSVKNGIGTVLITAPGSKGPDGTMQPEVKKTFQMDGRGKAVGDVEGMTQMASYPANSVKIGGTWAGSYVIQGLKADTKYTLLGMASKGGHKCAHIQVALSMGAPVNGIGTGQMYVSADDGQVVESGMHLKMNPPSQGGQPAPNIGVEFTMRRTN